MIEQDVIVLGAGAAGLFSAIECGKRGRSVTVLEHGKKVGRKILMSGGGRCNFTNMYISPENFLSDNEHFCKSALSQYTQWDFIALVAEHGIAYHEKTLGQLFCDETAKDIVKMLMTECDKANATVTTHCEIVNVEKVDDGFTINTSKGNYHCQSLIVATGGLSLPKLGATPFGFKLAEQFGLNVKPTRAGLVPFTLHTADKDVLAELSGMSMEASAECNDTLFNENILFTHRGISGPAVLQISSYWHGGDEVTFNLYPNGELGDELMALQEQSPDALIATSLSKFFPKRFVQTALNYFEIKNVPIKQLNSKQIQSIAEHFHQWKIQPNGTEGYRTAEVTLGGVDTDELSSKTMESRKIPGLYFVGEVMDVTGWLGGYNFQWAWSSGFVAGQNA